MSKASTSVSVKKPAARKVPSKRTPIVEDDPDYATLLTAVAARLAYAATTHALLRVDSAGLYDAYLGGFKPENRQHHTCHACRRFFEQFGGIVTVLDDGTIRSALWSGVAAPAYYCKSIAAVAALVESRPVIGVLVEKTAVLGTPGTGEWCHLSAVLPDACLWKSRVLSPHQQAAVKAEAFKNVQRAIASEYRTADLQRVVSWLESDALYRAENVLAPAKWLLERSQEQERALKQGNLNQADNLLWRAIATAPEGFCHPRASMVGTLLDDVASGADFDTAAAKFKAKMDPLQYQRPQAAPKEGTIAQAEKLFETLGLSSALERRFCRKEDIDGIWYPKDSRRTPNASAAGGVFSDVIPRGGKAAKSAGKPDAPAKVMTWTKFAATVLPTAAAIEHYAMDSFAVFTTAVHADAHPILMWDRLNARNPVAWSFWNNGSRARDYGLPDGTWQHVDIIALTPPLWHGNVDTGSKPKGVAFFIRGARAGRSVGCAGLFPESLRSELHGVRAVIEAKVQNLKVAGRDEPHVCAAFFQDTSGGGKWAIQLRVTAEDGVVTDYKLDRWD